MSNAIVLFDLLHASGNSFSVLSDENTLCTKEY